MRVGSRLSDPDNTSSYRSFRSVSESYPERTFYYPTPVHSQDLVHCYLCYEEVYGGQIYTDLGSEIKTFSL